MAAIIKSGFQITSVVCGCASGVDKLGDDWAKMNDLPVDYCPADWNVHGRKAGYLRNVEMADHADALVAVWDGKSKGTKHMIDIATSKGLKVYVEKIKL